MKITSQILAKVVDEAADPWRISNGVLYKLCLEYPNHQNPLAVTAKMLLIGRSYAAALERGRSAVASRRSSNDDFYCLDVPKVMGASELDSRLKALRSARKLTHHTVVEVLDLHGYLCRVMRELSGKTNRSLASKYLHFHLPNVFLIFDERARRGLSILEGVTPRQPGQLGKQSDLQYERFVRQGLRLRDRIHSQFGVELAPRQLDRLLLTASNHSANRQS